MKTVADLDKEDAVISACERYRYALHRHLGGFDDKACLFIMLNPSTADWRNDDPTIRRCINFAKGWGCDHLYVANLFAFRTAYPYELRKHGVGGGDVVGPDNRDWLETLADVVDNRADEGGPIVCAWGPNGAYMQQDQWVLGWLEAWKGKLQCLGRTKEGYPRHPLMLPKAAQLEPFA